VRASVNVAICLLNTQTHPSGGARPRAGVSRKGFWEGLDGVRGRTDGAKA